MILVRIHDNTADVEIDEIVHVDFCRQTCVLNFTTVEGETISVQSPRHAGKPEGFFWARAISMEGWLVLHFNDMKTPNVSRGSATWDIES